MCVFSVHAFLDPEGPALEDLPVCVYVFRADVFTSLAVSG